MLYTRVAIRMDEAADWRWKSATFSSLNTLFGFLQSYKWQAKDCMRVFFASSGDLLNVMLLRENGGHISNSITVEQFWQQRGKVDRVAILHLEMELVMSRSRQLVAAVTERPEYGHRTRPLEDFSSDTPVSSMYDDAYTFALPTSMRQALAWATLLAQVQRGELMP